MKLKLNQTEKKILSWTFLMTLLLISAIITLLWSSGLGYDNEKEDPYQNFRDICIGEGGELKEVSKLECTIGNKTNAKKFFSWICGEGKIKNPITWNYYSPIKFDMHFQNDFYDYCRLLSFDIKNKIGEK